jgi:hypothetical protein
MEAVVRVVVTSICMSACYSGAEATRDVNLAWQGRSRAELEDRWGAPADSGTAGNLGMMHWSHVNTHVELPSGGGSVAITPTRFDIDAAFRPGEVWHTTTGVAALIDATNTITRVEGASLRWGPPNDANLHWGAIFGMHVGLGRLDTTPTPLPSGNLYIGGMLGPTLGLVGTTSMVAGLASAGGAMAFGWGIGAQWWPINRLWVRGGPALLLVSDPGFNNTRLRPGVATGASYAFVKVGRFALDLCLDLTAGPSTVFGSVGVGANLN